MSNTQIESSLRRDGEVTDQQTADVTAASSRRELFSQGFRHWAVGAVAKQSDQGLPHCLAQVNSDPKNPEPALAMPDT